MELLTTGQRADGMSLKTPMNALPADASPEWGAALAALDKAYDALSDFDGEHEELLSEMWRTAAEGRERAYVTAIQKGVKPPARPKGGYVADAEDKRPAVVGEWFRLVREKDKADARAFAALRDAAPSQIPDSQAAIDATAAAYVEAEKALEKARDEWLRAVGYRGALEAYAAGGDKYTADLAGVPQAKLETADGKRLPASLAVKAVAGWLSARFGPADTGKRLPAKRRVRSLVNGAELTLAPGTALSLGRLGQIEYVDGFAPESRLGRSASTRAGGVVSDGE